MKQKRRRVNVAIITTTPYKYPKPVKKKKSRSLLNRSTYVKGLKGVCDKLWSKTIRERDMACQRCMAVEGLQAAHIFGRRYHSTRWDLSNGITLCAKCHVYYTCHPDEWMIWCIFTKFGEEEIKRLYNKAVFTLWDKDLERTYDAIKNKVDPSEHRVIDVEVTAC